MNTPAEVIKLLVAAGEAIDRRFPGLRAADGEAWAARVAWLGHHGDDVIEGDARIGRKSAGGGRPISYDTFGILAPEAGPGRFYAVSIIRHNPPGGNEWRGAPIDYGLVGAEQEWFAPEAIDVGGPPAEDPGDDPAEDPGDDPGEDPGDDPGEDPGEDEDPDPWLELEGIRAELAGLRGELAGVRAVLERAAGRFGI